MTPVPLTNQPLTGQTLTADRISFRHRPRSPWVLDDVSLELGQHEVVGLRGPSGLGKSTLTKVLAGLWTPTRGAVRVTGAQRQPGSRVQLVMQHPVLAMNPRWRLSDVLAEPLQVGERPEIVDQLVDPAWLTRFPHEVSGGQLQRVNLARALLADPDFLIADEITASLDAITQARIWTTLLAHTRRAGVGLLVISHDDALLARLCDRIVDLGDLMAPRSSLIG